MYNQKREEGVEKIFEEIMAPKFPNLMKSINKQIKKFNESKHNKYKENHIKAHCN